MYREKLEIAFTFEKHKVTGSTFHLITLFVNVFFALLKILHIFHENSFILDFDRCVHGLTMHMISEIYEIDTSTNRIVDI